MLRPRLQRLVDRVNASALPVVVTVRRGREGRLQRWELRVQTPAKPWAGYVVPLGLWRREPVRSWRERHPGSAVLPFQDPRSHAQRAAEYRRGVA